MVYCKSRKIVLVFLFLIHTNLCFSNAKIDAMCGIWTYVNPSRTFYESLALERISETEYFVLYARSVDHVLDFSDKGTVVNDNLIHIKKADDENFYVYLDYHENSVYLLWNHTDVMHFDKELKRISYYFDETIVEKREKEQEKKMREGVMNWLRKRCSSHDL